MKEACNYLKTNYKFDKEADYRQLVKEIVMEGVSRRIVCEIMKIAEKKKEKIKLPGTPGPKKKRCEKPNP